MKVSTVMHVIMVTIQGVEVFIGIFFYKNKEEKLGCKAFFTAYPQSQEGYCGIDQQNFITKLIAAQKI